MKKTVIFLSFTLISNLIAYDVLAQAERASQADSEDQNPPIRIFHRGSPATDLALGARHQAVGKGAHDDPGGGEGDKFSNLFFKLHEAFYKGGVTGIVFWGDVHLTSTPDGGNNGPFRRELVEASRFPLIRADIASDRDRSVIAFATENPDSVHVFYCATEPIRLEFDRPLNPDGIPREASGITTNGFDMPPTGNTDFGSFILSFSD